MSVIILPPSHFAAIRTSLVASHGWSRGAATEFCNFLLRAAEESFRNTYHREPEPTAQPLKSSDDRAGRSLTPGQLAIALASAEYQAIGAPLWEESIAKMLMARVRGDLPTTGDDGGEFWVIR